MKTLIKFICGEEVLTSLSKVLEKKCGFKSTNDEALEKFRAETPKIKPF